MCTHSSAVLELPVPSDWGTAKSATGQRGQGNTCSGLFPIPGSAVCWSPSLFILVDNLINQVHTEWLPLLGMNCVQPPT